MRTNCIKITALLLFMLFCREVSIAANTAILSGAWETATNWSSGHAPLATEAAVVPTGLTMTIKVTGDVCASLTIAALGSVIINANKSLSIGGSLTNAGTFTVNAGSTLTFNGGVNSTITGGGTYTIAGTVAMNMGSSAISLDVQDANFISGINSGGKYYFTFTRGIWKMDNTGTLNDSYNSGSANALTIPYGVTIESDNGTMNLAKNGTMATIGDGITTYGQSNIILSGKLFLNGGTVDVALGQTVSNNSGQTLAMGVNLQYYVNGGTPQLYMSTGTLNLGSGFNYYSSTDYIDFHMTGGTIIAAEIGSSFLGTFQLNDVVGGKSFMSGGLIELTDASWGNYSDADLGGTNVSSTLYSVTGGTIQFGSPATANANTYFAFQAWSTTNYPNFDFEPGIAKVAQPLNNSNFSIISLTANANMTFNVADYFTGNSSKNVTIKGNNGSWAFDDEGGFLQGNSTVIFSGSSPQLITSTAITNEIFYNLTISNTSGHVILGVGTTVSNQLTFTSGLLDATNYSLTVSTGSNAITGTSSSSYVITGNGIATTGKLIINALSTGTSTNFPIGTSTYYLPATINPGTSSGNSYAAFVFQGATTNGAANGTVFSAAGLAQIVNAVWNISQTAGSGTASLTLNWASSGTALEGSIFQTEGLNIGISQYTGGSWQLATGSGSVSTEIATSSFSSFTQFGVGGINQILPIIISDFNAALKNNNTVLVSWLASNNVVIGDFEVQSSTNSSDWHTNGTVQALSGTKADSNYSFIDASPAIGVNYYRLLIQNADGTFTYSAIKSVTVLFTPSISVFPNPANDIMNVSVGNANSEFDIRLISLSGQILQLARSTSSVISIKVSNYPPGIYLLEVVSPDRILQTNSVIIAH